MERFHKKVLQKNHTQIVNDLDLGQSSVLDSLREDGLISSNEEEIILSEKTKRNQNTKLLNYLKKRDPAKQPYAHLKRALESEYSFIVEKLNKSELELRDLRKDTHSVQCRHCALSKNLIPPDVTHCLFENGILTDDDLEELNNDNLPRHDRVRKLLNLLKKKPNQDETLEQFNNCLKKKYNYLVCDDLNEGLVAYTECGCKDRNGNITLDAKDDWNDLSHPHGDKHIKIPCNAIPCESPWTTDNFYSDKSYILKREISSDCNNESVEPQWKCDIGLDNDSVLSKILVHQNLSQEPKSPCETSWSGDFPPSDSCLSEKELAKSDIELLSKKGSPFEVKNNSENESEHSTQKETNDLSKPVIVRTESGSDQNKSKGNGGNSLLEQNKSINNGFQSGEDNTETTDVTIPIDYLHESRSICEDSWTESCDDHTNAECQNKDKTNDAHKSSPWTTTVDYNFLTPHSVFNSSFILTNTCNFKGEFAPECVSFNNILDLSSTLSLNGEHKQDAKRHVFCRLSSNETVYGVPILSEVLAVCREDEITDIHRSCRKVKKRPKRKKPKTTHTDTHVAFDDVDGNTKEETDHTPKAVQNDENEPDEDAAKDDSSEQGACSILQPVFKSAPNNKKLMRKCSRLWDQLFFLREKGDWETFGVVTKKAFDKFKNSPDIQVLLYRSEMCVSTFYKNDQTKALEMFDKALEQLPKTEMPNWHLARILPLKVELCTRAKLFEEASNLLEDAKQAMMSLGPCLSTGAVYFFEAIYLGNILQCTRNDTRSAEGITEQVKNCFLTAIEHYQQEETFAIKSFLNQVYLFLALFSLGVDFKRITYIQLQDIKREDISLAEHYLNLFENNCWGNSTNWSRMLFYIGRGEQHKQMNNFERSLDYFKQAKACCDSGKFGEHVAFIVNNIDVVTEKLSEKTRLQALKNMQSADDILRKVLESSSSDSGSNA